MQEQFDQAMRDTYYSVLQNVALTPPGSRTLDRSVVTKIQVYLDSTEEKTPVSVWNFYKMILDEVVRYALGNDFIIRLLDLEAFFKAPEGAFSQEAGNMASAPWRSGL